MASGHRVARYRGQFRPEFSRLHRDRDLFWVVPFPVRYIVGVTGERFSGKSSALAYLSEKKGFESYSLATDLREIAVRRGIPLEPRSRLQDLGDELRAEHNDPAYLARLTLRRIHREHLSHRPMAEAARRIAVGGFKRPEEIEVFENIGRFEQFDVRAGLMSRFERARDSGVLERELGVLPAAVARDTRAFEEHIDRRDLYGRQDRWTGEFGQAVQLVIGRPAAVSIGNEGTLADMYARLDDEVARLDDLYRAAPG